MGYKNEGRGGDQKSDTVIEPIILLSVIKAQFGWRWAYLPELWCSVLAEEGVLGRVVGWGNNSSSSVASFFRSSYNKEIEKLVKGGNLPVAIIFFIEKNASTP